MSSRRSPLIAFVMSCLIAGWGLVYVGRVKWALRVAGLSYGGLVLAGALGWIASPKGIYAFFIFVMLVKLVSAIAAAVLSCRHDDAMTLPSVRFHCFYVAALIVVTLVLLYPLRSTVFGYQLYYVPSGSMVPTLAIDDYIVTDTRYSKPKVGDIVVYRFNGSEATKRVAAVGGDTLQIVNGDLIVNGQNLGLFFAPATQVKQAYSLNLAPLKVEADHVYLLGDNRDVSNDSRFMGQVARGDITGKVTGIWLSKDAARIGSTFE
ncbi:signal peptidase I [Pseudomonas sp. Fl5BN2]|uniref:signal peptidase I n=1 Tax=Pseudomonas sp. Fl5BN2 TaxID=2697652 RepID=UPI0013789C6B|nr:signal peptidase I [Pseudomonas sp. Fl5BN2]NBF02193.1 signal peptidase I [Pseudomonas sp. Fl5BN2]